MSVEVVVELPEEVFSALRRTPETFVSEMRLAAAVKWYEMGQLSQGKAAELAGLTRRGGVTPPLRACLPQFLVRPNENAPDEVHTRRFDPIEGRARPSIRAGNAGVIVAPSEDKDKRSPCAWLLDTFREGQYNDRDALAHGYERPRVKR